MRDFGCGRDDVCGGGAGSAAGLGIQFWRRRHGAHGGQNGRGESGAQAFGGRRSGIWLKGQQIGNGGIGSRQIKLGRVDNFFCGLLAADDADGLRGVVSLLSSSASGFAGLRAAAILRLRQFVTGVVNDVGLRMIGNGRKFEGHKMRRDFDDGDEQQAFEKPAEEHPAIGEHAGRRFSGEALGSAGEGGAERGFKFLPRRGPFDEEAWRLGPLRGLFGNGFDFRHLGLFYLFGGFCTSVACPKGSG